MIQRAFSISFDAINILTELALIVWPTFVVVGFMLVESVVLLLSPLLIAGCCTCPSITGAKII